MLKGILKLFGFAPKRRQLSEETKAKARATRAKNKLSPQARAWTPERRARAAEIMRERMRRKRMDAAVDAARCVVDTRSTNGNS